MKKRLRRIFWKLPISIEVKNKIRDLFPRNCDVNEQYHSVQLQKQGVSESRFIEYTQQVIDYPTYKDDCFVEYRDHEKKQSTTKIIAYYLTQYHPTEKNNLWWGKGTTEWTNVTKAVPQFVGHRQPKLPGELGFYDLRLVENIHEQIKIAKNYGIYGFCFYYYWFNGERALEKPLNIFLEHQELDIHFSLCWCNEDWTKRYSGICNEVLLSVGKTEESYRLFIESILPYFKDKRYIQVDGKFVLSIYRPSQIPQTKSVIQYWREYVKSNTGKDLYIVASQEAGIDIDWLNYGFDAVSQFQPASIINSIKPKNDMVKLIRPDFDGSIFDYCDIVNDEQYSKINNKKKIYPAVMPSWDNTPRRNYRGNIFINSTPDMYKKWLSQAIDYVTKNNDLEENFVFINAWNEWGEGACLEPDREKGYAYLEATYEEMR